MANRSYNARCLVLSKTKLGETDSIVTLLCEDGHQVRAVAKGVRKPGSRIGARLEPYAHVDLLLHVGRSLDVVREVRTVDTNAACREDLDLSSACGLIAEFMGKVSRDADVAPRMFQLTEAAFRAIGEAEPRNAGALAAAHLMKSFAMLGVGPALRNCALCGDPVGEHPRFDLSAGGALCPSCARGFAGALFEDALIVRWADALMGSTFARIAGMEAVPVRSLLDFCESWAAEHLSVKLRSFAFLKSLY